MLQGACGINRLVLNTGVQGSDAAVLAARAACLSASEAFQVGEGSWGEVAQQVRRLLPKLQQLELQCKGYH
jgi:hypothetical protein